jgi:hypothetical protein
LLAVAPLAAPVCGQIAALVSVNDVADRPARALANGETLVLGRHVLRWFDTPHLPHAWECGFMLDDTTRTFFCGDLFTQGGAGEVALTESDILGPSEAFRARWITLPTPQNERHARRLAREQPPAGCMHVAPGARRRGVIARVINNVGF